MKWRRNATSWNNRLSLVKVGAIHKMTLARKPTPPHVSYAEQGKTAAPPGSISWSRERRWHATRGDTAQRPLTRRFPLGKATKACRAECSTSPSEYHIRERKPQHWKSVLFGGPRRCRDFAVRDNSSAAPKSKITVECAKSVECGPPGLHWRWHLIGCLLDDGQWRHPRKRCWDVIRIMKVGIRHARGLIGGIYRYRTAHCACLRFPSARYPSRILKWVKTQPYLLHFSPAGIWTRDMTVVRVIQNPSLANRNVVGAFLDRWVLLEVKLRIVGESCLNSQTPL